MSLFSVLSDSVRVGILNYLIHTEIHLATSIYMPAGLDDPNEPRHFVYLLLTCFRVRYWKLNNNNKIFPFHCFLYQANLSLVPYWRLFLNDTFLFIVCIFSPFLQLRYRSLARFYIRDFASSAWALCHICLPFLPCLPQLMVHTNLSGKSTWLVLWCPEVDSYRTGDSFIVSSVNLLYFSASITFGCDYL